jgi:hypothetical protein
MERWRSTPTFAGCLVSMPLATMQPPFVSPAVREYAVHD